ncbi:DUF1501 domain-containing protein [Fibrella sp. WM1]|uniref:DUF1501 domain-containing protein n=1 Tax=Fibrella musci TaxID=3242485 RepID=UPI0035213BEC
MDKLINELQQAILQRDTRRHFLQTCSTGLGAMALGTLFGGCESLFGRTDKAAASLAAAGLDPMASPTDPRLSQFAPKAKQIIYIHMAGSPSQLELFDYKPELVKYNGKDCPQELLTGKKFAFIRGVPKMLASTASFSQHGQSGAWISDYMPHLQTVADELTFIKSMHTDQFNHAPAQLLMHTGSARLGRPSIGSWVTYGLGTENANLPGFMVLASGGKQPDAGKSVWGSGFLPTVYQGVQCRTDGDPVLYVSDPAGMPRDVRKQTIEAINQINEQAYQEAKDPEILTRISQYEMAFKMQTSVPDAMDIAGEPEYILNAYGVDPKVGSFARNCLLARRLVERGVRFVQLFDWGWDTHGTSKDSSVDFGLQEKCRQTDQGVAALINDLKQRGLLDETLVVWGGEFGRTPMQENRDGQVQGFHGRDHHLDAFTVFMAGGGTKPGLSYGETDPIGYYAVKDKVHVHDLQATMLHLMGFDHTKLTYQFQGRPFRLTDVAGKVVKGVLA